MTHLQGCEKSSERTCGPEDGSLEPSTAPLLEHRRGEAALRGEDLCSAPGVPYMSIKAPTDDNSSIGNATQSHRSQATAMSVLRSVSAARQHPEQAETFWVIMQSKKPFPTTGDVARRRDNLLARACTGAKISTISATGDHERREQSARSSRLSFGVATAPLCVAPCQMLATLSSLRAADHAARDACDPGSALARGTAGGLACLSDYPGSMTIPAP